MHTLPPLPALAGLLLLTAAARAQTVQIAPSRDNTLFEPTTVVDKSNGVGPQFYSGRTNGDRLRRGVLRFDVAGAVPGGSTITGVTLRVNCSHVPVFDGANARTQRLRRATSDWGEGTSDAGVNNGDGVTPTPGDATWNHSFFSSSFWTTPGGDQSATLSSSVDVTGTGLYAFPSTPQLVADVQDMLDQPGGNFGWVVSGEEVVNGTARAFDTREAPTYPFYNGVAPVLEVTYAASVPSLPPWSAALLALLGLGMGVLVLRRRV